jgi:hypothetical protein
MAGTAQEKKHLEGDWDPGLPETVNKSISQTFNNALCFPLCLPFVSLFSWSCY